MRGPAKEGNHLLRRRQKSANDVYAELPPIVEQVVLGVSARFVKLRDSSRYAKPPNERANLPGLLELLRAARNKYAAQVKLSDWFDLAPSRT